MKRPQQKHSEVEGLAGWGGGGGCARFSTGSDGWEFALRVCELQDGAENLRCEGVQLIV